ncbi:UvrB/UvrC motif-containing protein [Aurantibacillus circumpalustris]|uniref:UvrB/UvrC motif-containing protein n=1 Tax=Aurantibacillus circumpalustris TaxID=3036359 RepID=UPI00295AAD49|nr:UvrB/UvrC motif-containing protein [Aurantibacillus circumpalustris]
MKKRSNQGIVILLLFLLALTSCRTTGKAYLYSESSIEPGTVRMKTAAILPNRLPVTMQNPEEWRRKNYRIMKEILERNGCNVISYETSNQMFQQSGLPMEDTKSSRDKYAELAQNLNADILIFPYYATSFNGNSFSNQYTSIGSLQIYSLKHNDFSARIDLEGMTKIAQWPTLVLPLVGVIAGLAAGGSDGAIVSGAAGVLTPLYLLLTLSPARHAYDKSFKRGLREAFKVYFGRYPQNRNNFETNESTSDNKYAKYSIEELQILKKAAVSNSDYEKAAEIKAEIESRK